MDWHHIGLLLAEAEEQKPPEPPPGAAFAQFLPLIAAFVLLFYFMILRPQKREQAARQALLDALKKNDKVITIGGIIGTVANISADGKEVTLKVDDNTRIRMIRSSIQSIVSAEAESDKTAESK